MAFPYEENVSEVRQQWAAKTGPFALAKRALATVWVARQVNNSVGKLRKDLRKREDLDEAEKARLWEELHSRNAKLSVRHIKKYGGMMTKVGQGMSTRVGELPRTWINELQQLQDQLPESPLEEVYRTIQKDLGHHVSELYADFSNKPIASASIAQTHVAHLRSNGRKVAVKVQHKGVGKVIGADLATLEFLAEKAARKYPDVPSFVGFIKEWRRASKEEVDFHLEADHMTRARRFFRRQGIDVMVPQALPACSGKHVLTMGFIEGWKITEVARLPRGTDRGELARRLVDAFAALVFEEGLIHGDPHPGNVFVSPKPIEGRDSATPAFVPVFLDWGLVQRMDLRERRAVALWALATLTSDRVLLFNALKELGFVFGADLEISELESLLTYSAWGLRDSIPSGAQMHFHEQCERSNYRNEAQQERGRRRSMQDAEDRRAKIVQKIPGNILFFTRALEMLQQVCGTLDAIVPFSQVILNRAMPLLQAEGAAALRPALPAPPGCSDIESAVRAKLDELLKSGLVLGAQVAMLSVPEEGGGDATWQCNVAAGKAGNIAGPLSESSLMPLLNVGIGVLIACLLSQLARRAKDRESLVLDILVRKLWPEFGRQGSGRENISIGQLLRLRAGIARPFPPDMTFEAYMSEKSVEEAIAKSSFNKDDQHMHPCPVLGEVIAVLLRRLQKRQGAAEAVASALRQANLQDHIVYSGPPERLAYLGRKPLDSLPLSMLFEWLEEREQGSWSTYGRWHTFKKLAARIPYIGDPLLLNDPKARDGKACLPGRGLRSSATALCKLYASDMVPKELLKRSLTSRGRLFFASVEAFEEYACCRDFAAGWQLFTFKREDGTKVDGYGYADGSTGSIALRLPGASLAVLLNSVDKQSRHVGRELVAVLTSRLGLTPVWHLDALEVSRPGATPAQENQAAASTGEAQPTAELEAEKESSPLDGEWATVRFENIEPLLDAFDVPALARAMVYRSMRRTLRIQAEESAISMHITTTIAGEVLEDSEHRFQVGDNFEGEDYLFGTFHCSSAWEEEQGRQNPVLAVSKQYVIAGRPVMLHERYLPQGVAANDGCQQMIVECTLRQAGEQRLHIDTDDDLRTLIRSVDAYGERLVRHFTLGHDLALRGGRLTNVPDEGLGAMRLPCEVILQYDDVTCRLHYTRTEPRAARARSLGAAAAGAPRDQVSTTTTCVSSLAVCAPLVASALASAAYQLAKGAFRCIGWSCTALYRALPPADTCLEGVSSRPRREPQSSEMDDLGSDRGDIVQGLLNWPRHRRDLEGHLEQGRAASSVSGTSSVASPVSSIGYRQIAPYDEWSSCASVPLQGSGASNAAPAIRRDPGASSSSSSSVPFSRRDAGASSSSTGGVAAGQYFHATRRNPGAAGASQLYPDEMDEDTDPLPSFVSGRYAALQHMHMQQQRMLQELMTDLAAQRESTPHHLREHMLMLERGLAQAQRNLEQPF